MRNIFKHKVSEEEAVAAVQAAVATPEEQRVYQRMKAREARESQARFNSAGTWSKHQRWDRAR